MSKPTKINLANIGGGGLAEDFDRELRRICENIADPNVPTQAVRSMNIAVRIKPDKRGQTAAITYQVKSTLAAAEPGATTAWIAMDDEHNMGLFGMDLRQNELPFSGAEPTVTEIVPVGDRKLAEMPTVRVAPPMAD